MMSEYSMPIQSVFRRPVPAGLELLEARACRLFPDASRSSYMDNAIIAARNACRRDLLSRFRLVT